MRCRTNSKRQPELISDWPSLAATCSSHWLAQRLICAAHMAIFRAGKMNFSSGSTQFMFSAPKARPLSVPFLLHTSQTSWLVYPKLDRWERMNCRPKRKNYSILPTFYTGLRPYTTNMPGKIAPKIYTLSIKNFLRQGSKKSGINLTNVS